KVYLSRGRGGGGAVFWETERGGRGGPPLPTQGRDALLRVPDQMQRDTLLMVADSERDANMLYAVGTFVPDPFIYLRTSGRPLIVMRDLEIDPPPPQAPHCRVVSLGQYQKKLRAQGILQPAVAHLVRQILREKRIRRV